MILLKLKCADRELDLLDWTETYPKDGAFKSAGETVIARIYVKKPWLRSKEIESFLHELAWFNKMAIQFNTRFIGSPVELWVKVDDGIDQGTDTLFGQGWVHKKLGGYDEISDPAIRWELHDEWMSQIEDGKLREIALHFKCAPVVGYRGEMMWAWEPEHPRWAGIAQGAIDHDASGGLILLPGITNRIGNCAFGHEADTDNGWSFNPGTAGTSTENTGRRYIYHGYFSYLLEVSGNNESWFRNATCANTNTHTLTAYVRRKDGGTVDATVCRLLWQSTMVTPDSYEESTERPGFYRLSYSAAGSTSSLGYGVVVIDGNSVFVDAFQLEEFPLATPFVCGDKGRGYSFSTAGDYTSMSVRAAAGVKYRNAPGTVQMMRPNDTGQIMVAWEAWADAGSFPTSPASADLSMMFYEETTGFRGFLHHSTIRMQIHDGTDSATSGILSFSKGDKLYFFFEWGPDGKRVRVFNEAGTRLTQSGLSTYNIPVSPGAHVWVGSNNTPADHAWNILQVQIWDRVLTEAEQIARVQCGVGDAELPFLRTESGDGTLVNHDDDGANHDNWFEVDNVPGDMDAAVALFIKNTQANPYRFLYVGQQRPGKTRDDLPTHKVGNPWRPWLEATDGAASYDSDTSDSSTSDGSYGKVAKTTPSNTSNNPRINIPVCNEPEQLPWHMGRFIALMRMKVTNANRFKAQLACVTAKHQGTVTPQVTAEVSGSYVPLLPKEQVFNIPSSQEKAHDALEWLPGDWAVGTDGVFCYIKYWLQATVASGDVYLDGMMLLPADICGWAIITSGDYWPQNKYAMISTLGGIASRFVHSDDSERFFAHLDYEGTLLTLPVKEPCVMVIVTRDNSSPYVWDIADTFSVSMKILPRYQVG